jgi:hypothetical protein
VYLWRWFLLEVRVNALLLIAKFVPQNSLLTSITKYADEPKWRSKIHRSAAGYTPSATGDSYCLVGTSMLIQGPVKLDVF